MALTAPAQAACPDAGARGALRVMTLNLLFSELATRDERIATAAQRIAADGIDAVLMQEIATGRLAASANTAGDLQQRLADAHGLDYALFYTPVNGVPDLLGVGNAILTRCAITTNLAVPLPAAREYIGEYVVPMRRRLQFARVEVPGTGAVSLYNTHLCAYCDADSRLEQGRAALRAVEAIEGLIGTGAPAVWGGDFNLNLVAGAAGDAALYQQITTEHDFTDAYAASSGSPIGCIIDPTGAIIAAPEACSYGVSDVPFFLEPNPIPQRIDYLFVRGAQPTGFDVLFNPLVDSGEAGVSDHSAVVADVPVVPR